MEGEAFTVKILRTELKDLLVFQLEPFDDFRGEFVELFNEELYKQFGIDLRFVEDDIAVSTKNVLRGLHGNWETSKLVSCVFGRVQFVAVDNRKESDRCRSHISLVLSDDNHLQVFVPPGFAIGYLVLSDMAVFHYKQSTPYKRESQFTLRWNDPNLNIWWGTKNPIISERDANAD